MPLPYIYFFYCGLKSFSLLRYKWLDGRFVGTAMKTVVSKVFIDQAISAPIILVLFYTGK